MPGSWGEGPFGINGRSHPVPHKGAWKGAAKVPPLKNKPSECLWQFSVATLRFIRKNTENQSFPSSLLLFLALSQPEEPPSQLLAPCVCTPCTDSDGPHRSWRIKVIWVVSGQGRNSLWTLFTINTGICLQMEDLKCSNKGKSIRCYQLHWHTFHPERSWLHVQKYGRQH